MRLRIGRPRVALIVAPHPDDEVIGAAGLIDRLVGLGTAVHVAIVTDGAASHPRSARWPRRRLIATRRAESRRALRRLGVMPRSTHFLGLADGGLAMRQRACERALAARMRRLPGLDLVVGPTRDDAHPDHRSVAAALRSVCRGVRLLGYRVWPAQAARGDRPFSIPVSSAAKRSLIGLYRTQLGLIGDDPHGFAIARHELDAFARPLELYREAR